MRIKQLIKVFILLITLIAICVGLYTMFSNASPNYSPKVSIALNETIHEVQAHSTASLEFTKTNFGDRDHFSVTGKQITFEYRDSKLGFTLPKTLAVDISTENSIIESLRTYPQLKLLNLKDSKELLKKIIKLFDDAGWQRNTRYDFRNPNDIEPNAFEHLFPATSMTVAVWQNENKELFLMIKRYLKKERIEADPSFYDKDYTHKPYEDFYLITVALSLEPVPKE